MKNDPKERLEGTLSLAIDNLDSTPGQDPRTYIEWLKRNSSEFGREPIKHLTTSERIRKVDENVSKPPLNVRIYGIDTYRSIIDALINNQRYRYYVDSDVELVFRKAKQISIHNPHNAIEYLKRHSTKVLKEEKGEIMEYTQYKGRIPSIFNKCAPIRNWDITGIVENKYICEQFDHDETIILEYKNAPFRINNGILTYYESDSGLARQFVRELVEVVRKNKRNKKNKLILDPQMSDLPVYEKNKLKKVSL